jgi:amino acid permease
MDMCYHCTLPAEITAAAVLIGFWDHDVHILLARLVLPNPHLQPNHVAIYVAVLIIAVYSVNLFGDKVWSDCRSSKTSDLAPSRIRFFGHSGYLRNI